MRGEGEGAARWRRHWPNFRVFIVDEYLGMDMLLAEVKLRWKLCK